VKWAGLVREAEGVGVGAEGRRRSRQSGSDDIVSGDVDLGGGRRCGRKIGGGEGGGR
jgi:hypothetical protein